MPPLTKSQRIAADQAFLAGLLKHLANQTFTIDGQPETTAQIQTVLQARIDKASAVAPAKATWQAAVAASLAEYDATHDLIKAVRQTVLTMYASSPEVLTDFGMVPRKVPAPLTGAERVVAAAKRAATRAARGTMSKKKKAQIVGTLSGAVTVEPDGSAAAAPPPASPATPPVAPVTAGASGSSGPSHA